MSDLAGDSPQHILGQFPSTVVQNLPSKNKFDETTPEMYHVVKQGMKFGTDQMTGKSLEYYQCQRNRLSLNINDSVRHKHYMSHTGHFSIILVLPAITLNRVSGM